jgi:hypothetical protein
LNGSSIQGAPVFVGMFLGSRLRELRERRMHSEDELQRCQAEIQRLEAENRDLRRASESFGHLAERLNRKLHEERRLRTADRRQMPRETPERRIG